MSPTPTDPDADAKAYYGQAGVKLDYTHAIWTDALLPLYRFWQQEAAFGSPMADLVKPGPVIGAEAGAVWGANTPAAVVRLTNRVVGVRQGPGGSWLPYQAEYA